LPEYEYEYEYEYDRRRLLGNHAVMIAVTVVWMVQVTIDNVVGVIAVLDCLVPAVFAVHVVRDMLAARVRHTAGWIHLVDLDHR
jgi:hypothetical protein